MPHLWMFLLQALTPPGHEVTLVDGNARAMGPDELVRFVREKGIGLVGIGSMTRMIAKAYRVADALRAAGVPVVMGGPHVSAIPEEPLGRDGGPRHADAVAIGEADETWPLIVADAARGELQEIYRAPGGGNGNGHKPSLQPYPVIPWESLDLEQFCLAPGSLRPWLRRFFGWETLHMIPIETGRGCPYGCEFCTVTGFFGESIRFRTNESIVDEMLRLKQRARTQKGQIAVFFIDDNLAINVRRTKSLLREIVAAEAQLPWVAQISANLLRDEELIDLIAEAGGKFIFIGMESIDPVNLADMHKGFCKPAEFTEVLHRLARRNVYAICSFIFGMDNDTPGVAERTLREINRWPAALPVFGQLTPFPATPLYDRLLENGRLTRPKHWLEFAPYEMAHVPLKLTSVEVRREITHAWASTYSPEENARVIESQRGKPLADRFILLIARFFFRSIYFPQKTKWAWIRMILQNRGVILSLAKEVAANRRAARRRAAELRHAAGPVRRPASPPALRRKNTEDAESV
jgi:radical SAM superfamily enzyme YgiQ (UPF0313 family)